MQAVSRYLAGITFAWRYTNRVRRKPSNPTPPGPERLEALERGLASARAERLRMQNEIRALEARDPLDPLRKALAKQWKRNPPGGWPTPFSTKPDPDDNNPDDTGK